LLARILCGVGVCACLMAPLTGYRRWYAPEQLMRANSWMLMVGAFGMVASTLPVQWLLPAIGWRGIFLLPRSFGCHQHGRDCLAGTGLDRTER